MLGLIDDLDTNRFTILRSLTLLRQLSLDAGAGRRRARRTCRAPRSTCCSSSCSDVTAGGHRALVFSQFTGFLGRVRERLDAEGIEYCYLDGSTRDRAAVVRRFKDGAAPVFLISLKAGGFGLNLTEADYCFLLDPWWNPATEAQAVDRTHRIGQTRNVMVYRLIAAGHHRGEGHGAEGPQGRAVRQRPRRAATRSAPASTPTTSAPCSPDRTAASLASSVRPDLMSDV